MATHGRRFSSVNWWWLVPVAAVADSLRNLFDGQDYFTGILSTLTVALITAAVVWFFRGPISARYKTYLRRTAFEFVSEPGYLDKLIVHRRLPLDDQCTILVAFQPRWGALEYKECNLRLVLDRKMRGGQSANREEIELIKCEVRAPTSEIPRVMRDDKGGFSIIYDTSQAFHQQRALTLAITIRTKKPWAGWLGFRADTVDGFYFGWLGLSSTARVVWHWKTRTLKIRP